jgi:hypothetical protein
MLCPDFAIYYISKVSFPHNTVIRVCVDKTRDGLTAGEELVDGQSLLG